MRATGPDKPVGTVLQYCRIGAFKFVQHSYPQVAKKDRHAHSWLHLSVVQEGYYGRKLGSAFKTYGPGAVSFLPTNEEHEDLYAPGSKCLHIVIPSGVEEALVRAFSTQGFPTEIPLLVSARFSVALHREFTFRNEQSALVTEALLLDLISRHANIRIERSSHRPPWMDWLLEYLDGTFQDDWSLETIAREMCVHPVYLCRAFSEHFHCTLGEYIRELRTLRAWQLIGLGHASIAGVASHSGFADQSHLNRVFRRRFGVSPGEYRRLIREGRISPTVVNPVQESSPGRVASL
jgi:AraC family transcriptional regulator